MNGKGKLSGFYWHNEFHNTNPKKDKAADCIYLTSDRICQNKDSSQYLAKCFIATTCPFRIKSTDAPVLTRDNEEKEAPAIKKQLSIKKIKCSLPKNCKMYSKKYGQGKYVGYNEESMVISVQLEEKIVRFQYPNSVLDKYLIVPKYALKSVMYDVRHAERG